MQGQPEAGEIYQHFKGNRYQIVCIAKNSEDLSPMVVYRQTVAPFECYVRPYDMFVSPVDRVKYPQVEQEYRFELVREDANSFLDAFLEADSCEEKLEILNKSEAVATEQMLRMMAYSMDIQLKAGSIEQQMEDLRGCLQMRGKYEVNRLRQ